MKAELVDSLEPDPFDTDRFPYGKKAGDNKMGLSKCPCCTKPPTHPSVKAWPWTGSPIPSEGFYMFLDELSAREYGISGLCQDCQDSVFAEPTSQQEWEAEINEDWDTF